MKVLLINPNRHTKYSKPPLGLLAIGSVCQADGHDVEIIDATLFGMNPDNILESVRGNIPDVVGITAMLIKNAASL